MKFNSHIENICSKISKTVGIMYYLKGMLPPKCLKLIYFSLIQSYIQYCLPIFGSTYDAHIEPLRILQKRAIRIINNASYYAHTEPLFFRSNILKIDDLYLHSIACYAFKNRDLLDNYRRTHSYNTRFRNLLLPPMERLRSSSQSVYFNVTELWDNIPLPIRQSNSYQSFKFAYKRHLLSQYEHSSQ